VWRSFVAGSGGNEERVEVVTVMRLWLEVVFSV
jgi:hypothetical protein